MKTKKLLIVALIVVGIFALAGCGGNKDAKTDQKEEKATTEDVKGAPEMAVTVAADGKDVKVMNYTEEEYDKLSDADKGQKMIENLVGKDGKSVVVVNVNDAGILKFDFKDKDGKAVEPKEEPEIKMQAMPGIMGVPDKYDPKSKDIEEYEGKLSQDDTGYYFSLKDYFKDHTVDDDAFCLIRVEYKIGDAEYEAVTAVLFDAIE